MGNGSKTSHKPNAAIGLTEKRQRRFWAKVDTQPRSSGCLLWTGAIDAEGYGAFWVDRARKAHQVAWEMEHGAVPTGLVLMHACDTRHCVNVVHLRVGTHQQNTEDMRQKGREGRKGPKLDLWQQENLDMALRAGESPEALARKFQISRVAVYAKLKRLRRAGLVPPKAVKPLR